MLFEQMPLNPLIVQLLSVTVLSWKIRFQLKKTIETLYRAGLLGGPSHSWSMLGIVEGWEVFFLDII